MRESVIEIPDPVTDKAEYESLVKRFCTEFFDYEEATADNDQFTDYQILLKNPKQVAISMAYAIDCGEFSTYLVSTSEDSVILEDLETNG